MPSELRTLISDNFPFVWAALIRGRAIVKSQLSQRKIRRLLKERTTIFLELGAGDKKGVGDWVTIDITKECDIFWDLRKGLPFRDQTITRIYSSHFFEHLSFGEGQYVFDECSLPIRLTQTPTRASVCPLWRLWTFTSATIWLSPNRSLSFSSCFPMTRRALPILRAPAGLTALSARIAA